MKRVWRSWTIDELKPGDDSEVTAGCLRFGEIEGWCYTNFLNVPPSEVWVWGSAEGLARNLEGMSEVDPPTTIHETSEYQPFMTLAKAFVDNLDTTLLELVDRGLISR